MFGRYAIWRSRTKRVQTPMSYSCYALRAASGAWIATRSGPGALALALDEAANPATRVVLCVSDSHQRFGCLFSPCLGRIAVPGHVQLCVAVPVRLIRSRSGEPANLVQAFGGGRRLCPRADGTLAFVLGTSGVETDFMLEPVDEAMLPAAARRLAGEFGRNMRQPNSGAQVMASLRRGTLRKSLAEAILCSLPIDALDAFASELATSPAVLKTLQAALPNDKWINARMDALLRWRARRSHRTPAMISVNSSDNDDLPGAGQGTAHVPQLGLCLNTLLRTRIQPRKTACVLASARNEGPFLLEWIAYHRSVGFDHIFLYTNENTDGSDDLLACLSKAGIITWLQNEVGDQGLPQFQAYAHALSALPDILDYRWTLIADLDEYFGFDTTRFSSVRDYIAWHEMARADAIALPWLLYIANTSDMWEDAPCIERFPMREEGVNPHVKTMFRTNLHWNSNCHHPNATLSLTTTFRLENGLPHTAQPPENTLAVSRKARASHAWIAHYIFRSAPEALMKARRGKGDSIRSQRVADLDRIVNTFVHLCEKTKLIPDLRTQHCAAGMGMELARLRAIPGVAAAEADIKADYAADMEALCLQFLRMPARRNESEAYAAFRRILLQQRQQHLLSGVAAEADAHYLDVRSMAVPVRG
jgi:hypothetical protein